MDIAFSGPGFFSTLSPCRVSLENDKSYLYYILMGLLLSSFSMFQELMLMIN